MANEDQANRLEGALLALLEHEERLARWQSLPATRQEAVEQLARMMLRRRAEEGGDEAGNADPAAAP